MITCSISSPALADTTTKPHRIISLAPHITEMLYTAGAGNLIVGVVSYSDYPADALNKPIIGSYNAINLEKIIELNPTLILGWKSGNQPKDLERLMSLGFKVETFEVTQLDDIPQRIAQLGELTDNPLHAQQQAKQLAQTLATTRQRFATKQSVSAFYEIWHKPIITMNDEQFISQAMAVCGANNVYADLPKLTGEVSLESVFERNPQLILLGGQQHFQQDWLQFWQQYPSLQAVKNQQIYLLNNNLYQRPTARLINALAPLCEKVDRARTYYQP